jgi:hypothetical protein
MFSLKGILVSSLAASLALALAPTLSRAEYANVNLTGVGSFENGCILLEFSPGSFNSGGYLIIDPSQPGAKQMLAIALTAVATGKSIQVDRQQGTPGSGALPNGCWGLSSYADDIRLNSI